MASSNEEVVPIRVGPHEESDPSQRPPALSALSIVPVQAGGVDLNWMPLGVRSFLLFAAIVLLGYAVGRLARMLHELFQHRRPTSGRILFGKLLVFIATAAAMWVALAFVYRIDPVGAFTAIGLVSLALGFGLQNTVANLAAGVGLTLDKPFEVGDRIQVGETWGDVIGIGLRSTRIRTTAGETVVIPNSILDRQELWNYTHHGTRDIRVAVPVSISYGSSIQLAEQEALRAVRRCDGVLAYPEPAVLVRKFGDNAVEMEVRFWIDRAQERVRVIDKVMRGIKANFDGQGVHFPFPQRTVGYLKDLPTPAPTPEFLDQKHAEKPIVLVLMRHLTRQPQAASRTLEFVDRIGARAYLVHIRPAQLSLSFRAAQMAVNEFMEAAARRVVPAHGRTEVGDLQQVLRDQVRGSDARLVLVPRRPSARFWSRDELKLTAAAAPLHVVHLDTERPVNDEMVERWKRRLEPVPTPRSPDEEAQLLAEAGAEGAAEEGAEVAVAQGPQHGSGGPDGAKKTAGPSESDGSPVQGGPEGSEPTDAVDAGDSPAKP